MSSVKPAIVIRPQGEETTLESITFELTEENMRELLGVGPHADLRALSHDDGVFIGVCTHEKPRLVHVCPQHHIVIRGNTLYLPLVEEREDFAGHIEHIRDVEPPDEQGLTRLQSAMSAGDEGGTELRIWKWGASFPTLNQRSRRDAGKLSGQILAEALSKMIGHPVVVQDVEVLKHDPKAQPLVVGERTFERFDISRILRNDSPEEHMMLLEVPAMVTYSSDHFPFPHSAVLSMLSFYVQLVREGHMAGHLTNERAEALVASAMRIASLIEPEAREEVRGKEWPMTVECWLPEGWDK